MAAGGTREQRLWWLAVGVAAVAGLVLRVLAARGGLWTDEAWSMIYAAEARDPLGVFLRINHDNNHHLNSLWLQAVGISAPPLLARLPAILAGTACIPMAALLIGRQSRMGGVVAAALLAVSPATVTLGSEARGYAPMLLAVLVMLLIVTRAIERERARSTPWWLALVALLGMLSHLTMAAPVALTVLWVYLDRRRAIGSREALPATARLMGPAVIACIAVVALVFGAALASPTGMRVGGYAPFVLGQYAMALDQLSGWATGLSFIPAWLRLAAIGVAAAVVALRPPQWLGSRGRLYALLVLGVPLAALVLRPGNAGFARYYVTSLVGLILLVGALAGRAFDKRGPIRWAAGGLLLVLTGLNLLGDAELIRLQRGRPDGAVADMAKLSPAGARLTANPRFEAIARVAATRAHYPAQLVSNCEAAEFLLIPRPEQRAIPPKIVHCGVPMRERDSSTTSPMTGDAWVLYGAQDLAKAPTP
jgi:hypothetical protein